MFLRKYVKYPLLSDIIRTGGDSVAVLSKEEKKVFFEQNIRELTEAIKTLEDSVDKDEYFEKLFVQIKRNIQGAKYFSNY